LARQIATDRENKTYLPGIVIPPQVVVSSDIAAVLENVEIVFLVVPSHTVRDTCQLMFPYVNADIMYVSATKGIENESLMRMSEVINEVLSRKFPPRIAVLSGPSFALETARGDPTAIVVGAKEEREARRIQQEFSGENVRLYTNTDVTGIEIGGAVKNVIAIAAGVISGLGFGSNTLAGLITRGLAEITRLATAMGGRPETLAGLAGLGDLVLTCTGQLSRNRSVGIQLGQGRKLREILEDMTMVAEGIRTTKSTRHLAKKFGVEIPITEQMYAIMYMDKSPHLAIRDLMERELKEE
jgi:glycerol-3-phosphate dehydrogenase (NAD(P)+)